MRSDAIGNCARLRHRFNGCEAIYLDQGAFRVRVTAIEADVAAQHITADIEEIPTPGLPGFVGLDGHGLVGSRRLKWSICTGPLTAASDSVWSYGDGGWLLFFDSDLVQDVVRFARDSAEHVVRFAGPFRVTFDRWGYEQYRNIVGWLTCHPSTQGSLTRLFAPNDRNAENAPVWPEPPSAIADGMMFAEGGCTLPWGTPLHDLATIGGAETKWRADAIFLEWRNRTCLGLRCDVSTGRHLGPPSPFDYHPFLDRFHSAVLRVIPEGESEDLTSERGFRAVCAQLENSLGPATVVRCPFEPSLSADWCFRGIKAHLFAAQIPVPVPLLSIDHEPQSGYPALLADARALARWQGRGATPLMRTSAPTASRRRGKRKQQA